MKKKFDYSKLNKIFEENWSSLSERKKLNSLQNWDSLKQIELIVLIEKKLKRKLSVKEILRFKTVKDINLILK